MANFYGNLLNRNVAMGGGGLEVEKEGNETKVNDPSVPSFLEGFAKDGDAEPDTKGESSVYVDAPTVLVK